MLTLTLCLQVRLIQSEFEVEERRIRESCGRVEAEARRKVQEVQAHAEEVEKRAAAAQQAADDALQQAEQMQKQNSDRHFELLEASCRVAYESSMVELEGDLQREELASTQRELEHMRGLKEAAENLLEDTQLANQVEREGAFALYAQQESNLETANEKLAAVEEREQEARSQNQEQEALIESLRADICAMAAKADVIRDDGRRAKHKVKKELEARIQSLEEALEGKELQVTLLECNADTDKAIIEARDLQVAALEEAVRTAEREKDASHAAMQEAQDQVEQACTVEEMLSAQVAAQKKELAKANLDAYRLRQELEKAVSMKDLAEKTLSRDRKDLEERLAQLTHEAEASQHTATLQGQLDTAQQELNQSTTDRAVLVKELEKVAAQRDAQNAELAELRREREGRQKGFAAEAEAMRQEWNATQRDLCLKHESNVRPPLVCRMK